MLAYARRLRRRLPALLFALALLLLWELISRADTVYVPASEVPPPSLVVVGLANEITLPRYWAALADTLAGWALGLAIATTAAVPIGILIGSSGRAYRSMRALIDILRALPGLGLLPLVLLVLGLGFNMKVFLVALGSFWVLLVQAIYAVQDVDPTAREMAKAYGLGRAAIFTRVVLPSVVPYVMTGLRLGAIVALNIVIGVELIVGASQGVGNAINFAWQLLQAPRMFAYVVTAALLGVLVSSIMRMAERRVLFWHSSQRGAIPL